MWEWVVSRQTIPKERERGKVVKPKLFPKEKEIISQQHHYLLSNIHSYLIGSGVCLQCVILFSICFSVVFPFLIPLMVKMNVSFFPADAVDFFMRSLSKIKQDRKKDPQKVNEHEFAISCGRK